MLTLYLICPSAQNFSQIVENKNLFQILDLTDCYIEGA